MPPAFLADFAPLDGAFQLNVYSLILLLGAIGGLWVLVRRRPPLDTHLSKLEIAIAALQTAVEALTSEQKKHVAHEAKIAELELKVRHLETHRENDSAAQRSYMAKNTREIFERIESESRQMQDKIDAFNTASADRSHQLGEAFSTNIQTIERGLGRLEGAIEVIKDRLNHKTP